jgi:hypothetical protein
MQYLVQTSDASDVDWSKQAVTLRAEAERAYALWKDGTVRQLWFTEAGDAVLLLECVSKAHAKRVLATLPLIKQRLLTYTITELKVYTGFDRLIEPRRKSGR